MDFACAECGRSDKMTYVVTQLSDDDEDRTEVCLECHYKLAEGEIHDECVSTDTLYERLNEAEKDTRENIQYELRSELDELVRAVEVGRADEVVGSTDLLLHGEAVAVARAALEIALEAAGQVPAWQTAA